MSAKRTKTSPTPLSSGSGRWRTAGLALLVALAAATVTTFVFAPRFVYWRGLSLGRLPTLTPEYGRAISSLAQIDDPWAPVDNELQQVIRWRLLFPLVWHYLALPRWLYLALPQIGCLLALWLTAWLLRERLGNWLQTWMGTTLFAALPWFFVSSGWLTYFDSWLVLGLLVAAFIPNRTSLALACLFVPWIDERFLLALPVTLLIRAVVLGHLESQPPREMLQDVCIAIVASLPYPALRAMAALYGDAASTGYVRTHWQEARTVPVSAYLLGLWSGFRAGWLMVGAGIWFSFRQFGWRWGMALAIAVLGTAVGGLFIAADMSRTLMVTCPALPLGICLWKQGRPTSLRWALPVVVAANLLLPATHAIWFLTIPVASLPSEIYRWRHPPIVLATAEFCARGKALVGQEKFLEARDQFDAAIRLDPRAARFYVERCTANIGLRDLARAEADVAAALRLAPKNRDALFLRAYLLTVKGDTSAAADELRKVLEDAPPNWPLRDEAQRLLEAATKPSSRQPDK